MGTLELHASHSRRSVRALPFRNGSVGLGRHHQAAGGVEQTKIDCAVNGPHIRHWHDLVHEIYKMLWGAKFDQKVPDLAKTYGQLQRSNVLTQIEKLARVTDRAVQRDYQWLCNAVHPSIGGMLAFAAPLMAHQEKTCAFQWVSEVPLTIKTIEMEGGRKLNAIASIKPSMNDGEDNPPTFTGVELRETTIQEAIARASLLAVEVLEKTLDDALKVIDDIGLTMEKKASIDAYEAKAKTARAWA